MLHDGIGLVLPHAVIPVNMACFMRLLVSSCIGFSIMFMLSSLALWSKADFGAVIIIYALSAL